MQAAADNLAFAPPPEPAAFRGFVAAILAHLLLMAALTWGINWNKDETPVAVQAELWSAVPEQAAPAPAKPPPPPPPPPVVTPPVVAPPVVQPPVPAPPVVQPAPPPPVARQPDIAIEQEKQRKRDEALRAQRELDERRKLDAQKKLEAQKLEAQKRVEAQKLEAQKRVEAQKLEAQKKRQLREEAERAERAERKQREDQLRLAKEQAQEKERARDRDRAKREQATKQQLEAARQENLKRMLAAAGPGTGAPNSAGTAARSRGPSGTYAGRIAARIKPNIVFTDVTSGNHAAVIHLRVAPDGTIVGSKLVKSSGVKSWDDAVLRAVERTEIIPRDTDGSVVPEFDIEFRPRD